MNKLMKHRRRLGNILCRTATSTLAALLLGACERKTESPPAIRPVRHVIVEQHDVADPIIVTGHLRARDEVSLAFRISGKVIERIPNVGDTVEAGQIVARLDPQVERNSLNAAQADVFSAQAVHQQARAFEKREKQLLTTKMIAPDEYDVALRQLKTGEAQVVAAQAKLKSAEEQLGYTELKSEAAGVITQKGAEPGEVVQAGQMILMLARQGGRDAVFDMPAQVIRDGLSLRQQVEVWLADKQDINTTGTVREISPQADPITRNYQVKVGLVEVPVGMFLGATVVGRLELQAGQQIKIPSTALTMRENNPSVWVIDAGDKVVHLRGIKIARYTPDSVVVTDGLKIGEMVVTAGVQELHEGQIVKLLGDAS
jgi:membrane fusion protein, multidrug efflux system